MLLLEEYLPQLGIWVPRFPRKGEGWELAPAFPFNYFNIPFIVL